MRSSSPWYRASKNCWYVWHEGKQVSLKVKGAENEQAAVKAWHRLMGGVPVDAVPMPVHPVFEPSDALQDTLPALVTAFLSDATSRVKPVTVKWYAGFLTPFAEAFKNKTVSAEAVERWSKSRRWCQSSRHDFIGVIVSLFKWSVETGRLERSPVRGIKKPAKQSRGRKAVITADDHARLLAVADGDWRDFLQLLWLTGCRPGELSGLTATDVDLSAGCVILTRHKTAEQTGRDRLIVLCDDAQGILHRLVTERPSGLLFPGDDGQRMTPQAVTKRMHRVCKKAGVRAIAYGYRHSYATDALSRGVPDAVVAELLGHNGTAMLHKHYSHLTSRVQVLNTTAHV